MSHCKVIFKKNTTNVSKKYILKHTAINFYNRILYILKNIEIFGIKIESKLLPVYNEIPREKTELECMMLWPRMYKKYIIWPFVET